jgi:hypothetical protein
MKGTNEVFTDYEKYLKRLVTLTYAVSNSCADVSRFDYLNQASYSDRHVSQQLPNNLQKKFVDAVNGKSGLNFFDALESEVCLHKHNVRP